MSRPGSQEMKSGSIGGRGTEGVDDSIDGAVGLGVTEVSVCEGVPDGGGDGGIGAVEAVGGPLRRSIILAILSSSSGQISGQWENPK